MKHLWKNRLWSRRLPLISLVLVLLFGLAACYPGGPENLDELGLVMTIKNPDISFAGLMTYAMEDTVVGLGDGDPIDIQFNPTILQALQDNMEARGFTREMDPETNKPDVWLAVGTVEATVWFQWYSWGYWGGYYPPGWGGGYYPPYTGVGSFQQGSVVWQMLDLRDVVLPITDETKPPALWLGGINGAIKSSDSANHAAITSGIEKAFAQSPYIIAAPPTEGKVQEVAR